MTHQPYIDWLFIDSADLSNELTSEQQTAFQAHLENCPDCRQLAVSWRSIENELYAAPQLAPASGFSTRWQARVAADKRRTYQRQGFITLGYSLGIGLSLLAALAFMAWPLIQNPSLLVWTFLYQFARWYSILGTVQQLFVTALPTAQLVYIPVVWMFTAVFIGVLVGLWVMSYRFFTNQRSVPNENKI